jgi:DNA-binding response OmpR family regulator
MQIACLHDNAGQSDLVCQVLKAAGHACQVFNSAKEFLYQLQRESYLLLMIDCQMQEVSGCDIVQTIREKLPADLPVLWMTNASGNESTIAGLVTATDDYLVKPIRRGELRFRVELLLQRAYPERRHQKSIEFGSYLFSVHDSRIVHTGKRVEVTQKEFELALLFFRHLGRPLSRAYILNAIWTHDPEFSSRTIDTHVSRVRTKLQLQPENGFQLVPVYSYGYRLEQFAGK